MGKPDHSAFGPGLAAVLALLSLAVTACAGSVRDDTSLRVLSGARADGGPGTAPGRGWSRPTRDGEGDSDDPYHRYYDEDDRTVLTLGTAAPPVLARAIAQLVTRYYAVAAAGDGATACRMLYPPLAEAIPESAAEAPDGKLPSCAAVARRLFRSHRRQVLAERLHMVVGEVRIEGARGFALVGPPGRRPKRYISIHREGNEWRINEMLDSSLP